MENNKAITLYDILGVSVDATNDEINASYQERVGIINQIISEAADKSDKMTAAEIVKNYLTRAFDILSNDDLKKQYDLLVSRDAGNINIDFINIDGKVLMNEDNQPFTLEDFFNKKEVKEEKKDEETVSTALVPVGVPVKDKKDEEEKKEKDVPSTAIIPVPGTAIRVNSIEESEDAKEASKKGNSIFRVATAVLIAAALLLGGTGIAYYINTAKKGVDKNSGTSNTTSSTTTSSTTSTTTTSTPEEKPVVIDPIFNFGDATDSKVVESKVNELSELLNSMGVVDPQTKQPYAAEDLKNVLLFMNGAFIPECDEEAYAMVNRQLDLTAELIVTPRIINLVMYMAGSELITTDTLKEDIKNNKDLCLVDTMLFGDSYCYPYLMYLEKSYNDLLKTTDKDLFIQKYTKVVNSLANLVYGKGCTIDNKVFTIADFSGLGDINDGNLLNTYVNMLSVLNVEGVNQFITIPGRDGADVTVTVEELFSNFDLVCVSDELGIDDNGKIVGNAENFHQRNQINTINVALENRYHGNLNAYNYNFNKHLGK